MADEVFDNYRYPGQSVPTPPAPIISGMDALPIDNTPPPAPILSANGGQGSIDPAADSVMEWWLSQDTQAKHGSTVTSQFNPASGALYQANQASLKMYSAPFYMPSGLLSISAGRSILWSVIGAALAFALPPTGKKTGAKVGWGIAGFFFPTLTTGAVALRAVTKK